MANKTTEKMTGEQKPVKKGGVFRLKAFIPFGIITAAVIIFYFIFLDSIVKEMLIDFAEEKNKAEVNIADLDLSLLNLGFTINGVQWTDRDHPLTNLFEIKRAACTIYAPHFINRKFHINELSVTGLEFKTPRSSDGTLTAYKAPAAQVSGTASAAAASAKTPQKKKLSGGALANIKKINASAFVASNFADVSKDINSYKSNVSQKKKHWQKKVKSLSDFKSIKKDYNSIKKINPKKYNVKDIKKIKNDIQKIKKLKSKISQKKKSLQTSRRQMNKDFNSLKQDLARIKQKGKKDILAKLNLSDDNLKNISSLIFGNSFTAKLFQYKKYYDRYSDYLPDPRSIFKKDADKEKEPQAFTGTYIDFTGAEQMPFFIIKKISLDASRQAKASVTGSIKYLSSDFSFKPMEIDINGKNQKENTSFSLKGYMAKEKIKKKYYKDNDLTLASENINLQKQNIFNNNSFIKGLKKGSADAVLKIKDKNNILTFKLIVKAREVTFSLEPMKDKTMYNILKNTLTDIPLFTTTVTTIINRNLADDKTDTDFSTTLDNVLNKKLKASINKQLTAKKKEIINSYNKKAARAFKSLQPDPGSGLNQKLNKSNNELGSMNNILNKKQSSLKDQLQKNTTSKIKKQTGKKLKNKLKF